MTDALVNPTPEQKSLIDWGRCGALIRTLGARSEYCTMTAGLKTIHSGSGRCWLHDGHHALMKTGGRYGRLMDKEVGVLQAEHMDDDIPLSTLEDIAMVRALLENYIRRYDEFEAAIIAWHESYQSGYGHQQIVYACRDLLDRLFNEWGKDDCERSLDYIILKKWVITAMSANPKPLKMLDLSDAVKYCDTISKMVERVSKRMDAQSLSRKSINRIMNEIGNIIDQCVMDDGTKLRIRARFAELRFD